MDAIKKYQRIFLIFNPEDAGYGIGQEPSGYVKIEVNEGKGKLLASVQNLNDNRGLTYKLYIFKCTESEFSAVCMGEIPLARNKGELKCEFGAADVKGSSVAIQEFNAAAVIGEGKNSESMLIICPLAAYKNGKVQWRDKFRSAFRGDKKSEITIEKKGTLQEDEIVSKHEYGLESKYVSKDKNNITDVEKSMENYEVNKGTEIEEKDNQQSPETEAVESPEKSEHEALNEYIGNQMDDSLKEYDEYQEMLKELENKDKQAETGANEEIKDTENSGCCVPVKGDGENNPCENCQVHNSVNTAQSPSRKVGNIDKLRINLDKFFQIYEPFSIRRRDYRWWKIGSPVQLNNILYQCDIKTPLLFNPALMMAHFKYRHLIIGIYSDRMRRREYLVCGVPGVFNIDERPFGNMCRWAQVEGSRPRYGAFGYWLVYIDPKTGKFLSM